MENIKEAQNVNEETQNTNEETQNTNEEAQNVNKENAAKEMEDLLGGALNIVAGMFKVPVKVEKDLDFAYLANADFSKNVNLKGKIPEDLLAEFDKTVEENFADLGKNSKIAGRDQLLAVAIKDFVEKYK